MVVGLNPGADIISFSLLKAFLEVNVTVVLLKAAKRKSVDNHLQLLSNRFGWFADFGLQ